MHRLADVVQQDWIGKEVKIVSAKNKAYLGIVGIVIDETKHFLIIKTPKKIIKVLKQGSVFQLSWNSKKVNVQGELIMVPPEERLKLKV